MNQSHRRLDSNLSTFNSSQCPGGRIHPAQAERTLTQANPWKPCDESLLLILRAGSHGIFGANNEIPLKQHSRPATVTLGHMLLHFCPHEFSGAEQVPSTQLLDQLVRKPQQESDTRACECFIISLPLVSAHVYNQTKSIFDWIVQDSKTEGKNKGTSAA